MIQTRLRSIVILTAGFTAIVLAVLVFLPVCLVLLPSRRLRIAACNVFGKIVGAFCLWLGGAEIPKEVQQRMNALHPAIYVSNHTSVFDVFIAIWSCPLFTCGVAKKSVAYVPFFGQLYLVSGHLLVNRSDRKQAVAALDSIARLTQQHKLGIWIWAEGTRSRDGRLLPLKKGFAHLALATRLPIVPVVVRGAHRVWEKNTMTLRSGRGVVGVTVLDPIATLDWTEENLDQHVATVHAAIAAALPDEQKPLPALAVQAA
jgi:1-acyl-sn-glycerol-3-phosphate acyltransferase